jgi:galactokinase
MAIDLGTTVDVVRTGDFVALTSDAETARANVPIHVAEDVIDRFTGWARYVAAVTAVCHPAVGARGAVTTTLPIGAGLSSSAALEVALALAVGHGGPSTALARDCRRAEHLAVGVPCGLMDQLTSVHGQAGCALLIDFTTEELEAIPVPDGVAVFVVHSGVRRSLANTPYATRLAECEAAARLVGPLRDADHAAVEAIADPALRRRARHVVTENARVRAVAAAFRAGDLALAGQIFAESQRSLREDMEVSTAVLDQLIGAITTRPGVYGARITGAGFGGCIVVLAALDVTLPAGHRSWRVRPSDGARLLAG